MKILGYTMAVFTILLLTIVAVGCFLPRSYMIESEVAIKATPEQTFRKLTDVENFLTWRRGIKKVDRLPAHLGREGWREARFLGSTTVEIIESKSPTSVVLRVHDTELPFQGVWKYEITPRGEGANLKLHHEGEIANPLMRIAFRLLGWRESLLQISLWELASSDLTIK